MYAPPIVNATPRIIPRITRMGISAWLAEDSRSEPSQKRGAGAQSSLVNLCGLGELRVAHAPFVSFAADRAAPAHRGGADAQQRIELALNTDIDRLARSRTTEIQSFHRRLRLFGRPYGLDRIDPLRK